MNKSERFYFIFEWLSLFYLFVALFIGFYFLFENISTFSNSERIFSALMFLIISGTIWLPLYILALFFETIPIGTFISILWLLIIIFLITFEFTSILRTEKEKILDSFSV
ncbi:MAG: hypothetical protein HeimC3_17390 [Candidatus Heimdallarchaeota archaeon LC_3]|nr:MAG: hypothetical protein HeimC3_17390 [Candidatus Heimdallarchaeota archaeon LC_3]